MVWVPVLGVVLIAAVFAAVMVLMWRNTETDIAQKVLRTIACAGYALLFGGLEVLLAGAGADGDVTGPQLLFDLACACASLGGVSALVAQARALRATPRVGVVQAVVAWVFPLLAIPGVSVLCFLFLEMPSNPDLLQIADPYLTCELAVITGVVAGFWLICQRRPVGFIVPLAASLLFGAAEHFVEVFKSSAISPADLRSFGTGLSVAGGYEYEIGTTPLIVFALFAFSVGALAWVRDPLGFVPWRDAEALASERGARLSRGMRVGAEAVVSVLLGIVLIAVPVSSARNTSWSEEGVTFDYWDLQYSVDEYGLIPSFFAALEFEEVQEPAGYQHDEAEVLQSGLVQLYDQYVGATPERQAAVAQFDAAKPNVILIMNESFADLSFLGDLEVGYAGPEYLRSMEAIAKGATSVSIYGGGTCNSEFEALTGTSLGYTRADFTPYVLCDLSRIETAPKLFKDLGYETTAIHPEDPSNWSRDQVYPAIGFDEFISESAFKNAERVRGHVSDAAVYEEALDVIAESDAPQFIFGLTMMGHGGYETGLIAEEDNVGYDFSAYLDESDGAALNEYLSTIRLSDRHIQELLVQLEELDEPTVVVFFGDHEPWVAGDLVERFADASDVTRYQQSRYRTDYFIWSNYEVAGGTADQYEGTMSPADLLSWTMSSIGAPLSAYEKASFISRAWAPANNLFGYLSSAGEWYPLSAADAVAGEAVFEEGMGIIGQCMAEGIPWSEVHPNQDAVMVNVMEWIAYLNFAEALT